MSGRVNAVSPLARQPGARSMAFKPKRNCFAARRNNFAHTSIALLSSNTIPPIITLYLDNLTSLPLSLHILLHSQSIASTPQPIERLHSSSPASHYHSHCGSLSCAPSTFEGHATTTQWRRPMRTARRISGPVDRSKFLLALLDTGLS
jgi:hypothetical protein